MTFDERQDPLSAATIAEELRMLGVREGDTLIVHSSLKAFNRFLIGGAPAVILGVEAAVGESGTVVMPAHSGDLSDPERWENPPVPKEWWAEIRTSMPAFDRDLTPTYGIGAVAETFRKQAGTLRSGHPQVSFCARGPKAAWYTAEHPYDDGLGERSPLAKLYEDDARILLLGAGHDRNTTLHLAEYRARYRSKSLITNGAPVIVDGVRELRMFHDIALSTEDFEAIGTAFEQEHDEAARRVIGEAVVKLIPVRQLVDFAVRWMEKYR
ncbi:aminoglycoside N(3)-acetyltransferase [Paenibacillus xanthanilyticus]|uniref:Aminoglycoside N(3)-acetyltransferase n=1 Tax=Paenibacillus xanthanilyticus TaxID=1783531 RepID=A0ABV8K6N0_9BACL